MSLCVVLCNKWAVCGVDLYSYVCDCVCMCSLVLYVVICMGGLWMLYYKSGRETCMWLCVVFMTVCCMKVWLTVFVVCVWLVCGCGICVWGLALCGV